MANRRRKVKQWQIFFSWAPKITVDVDCSCEIKRCLLLGRKSLNTILKHCIKNLWHHFANKGSSSQSYGFSISHVWMWELDHKEGRIPNDWCFQITMLEKTLESPLDCKEIKPVNPKGNQSWIFIKGLISGRSNTLATWWKEQTPWKRRWCWKRLKSGGEGSDRGWDG